jgi:rsbT co-antagonist protein RsbR
MPQTQGLTLAQILVRYEAELLTNWVDILENAMRTSRRTPENLRTECKQFLKLLPTVAEGHSNETSNEWNGVQEFLRDLSSARVLEGSTPSETATFIFSLKEPLFQILRKEDPDSKTLAAQIWQATELLDELGLYTVESYQRTREGLIRRQQQELMELSTPVIKVWGEVLAVPLIGTLDSARTQIVMENLLEEIVRQSARVVILDITGVPTVDTQTAQHLIKTVAASRLMGTECIISGIRPQIAQTIVHLGIEINDVVTKASLADALALAMKMTDGSVYRARS